MREPLISRARRGLKTGTVSSIPAPIGGWNTRDPKASMKPADAIWLENWWPGQGEVSGRKGAKYHLTGISGSVYSLLAYNSATTRKLFAATTTNIYDATATGAVGASVVAVSSGKFHSTLFNVLGGSYLIAVNGVDKLLLYDGATWKFIDNASTPAITGLATTSLANVHIFKQRLWFVQKSSMSVWYLPVNQIGGALTEFPLGQLFRRGGHLVAMASWSIDAGDGPDDYAVFASSEGELAVYKGIDPASDFNLVGIFYFGPPAGQKCLIPFGGDLLFLSSAGLLPLAKSLPSITLSRKSAVSDKIAPTIRQAVISYGLNFGWQGEVLPAENMLLLNVPVIETAESKQFVMNTVTGAWALFSGWNAICFTVFNDELYFGASGYVAKAATGLDDFGAGIGCLARQAFNYLKSNGLKHVKEVRPLLAVTSILRVDIGIDVDFEDIPRFGQVGFTPLPSYNWDAAQWDAAFWGEDETVTKDWKTVFSDEGFCHSLRLRVAAPGVSVKWSSTDFLYQLGGPA